MKKLNCWTALETSTNNRVFFMFLCRQRWSSKRCLCIWPAG